MNSTSSRLTDLTLLAILVGLAGVLTAAMGFQFVAGEIPCPLCLLQRIAMFGVCFGIIAHFRRGHDVRNVGIGLVWGLFLLIVSVRQVLINIVVRPGHAYPGSAVLGLHMPIWSVIIALAILLAFATILASFGNPRSSFEQPTSIFTRAGKVTGLYVIVLCVLNLASVVVQCELGACHTTGYSMFGQASRGLPD